MANPINNTNTIRVIQLKEKGPTLQTKSPSDNFNWCSYIRKPGVFSFVGSIEKIDHDDNNNTYYAGSINSNNNNAFPTNTGTAAFPTPIGGDDITVMMLTDDIEIKWATYFGGTDSDNTKSISVNGAGSTVFVVGTSASTDFPASSTFTGSYQETAIGNSFILELNQFGQPLWATKFELEGDPSTWGIGLRDCQEINGDLYVVGNRMGLTPSSMPNNGQFYHSLNGTGFIGIFKAGGVYFHGTAFGSTVANSQALTDIFSIDYNGSDAIAITGSTKDHNLPTVNAPVGNDVFTSENPNHTNAFIAKMSLNGNLDFSYYVHSAGSPSTWGGQLADNNAYYNSLGDRGNDIAFSPDGSSIYMVGELYGGNFAHHPSSNPNAYNQPNRSIVTLNPGQRSSAGFIFKTNYSGAIQSANYFSPSSQIFWYTTTLKLHQISFDNTGNYYITGNQGKTYCDASATPDEYNIPKPITQPVSFYQKMKTTHSNLTSSNTTAAGINSNSFIIGFNASDEYIWSTYVSGYRLSVIKPLTITNSNHLYFGGISSTINQLVDDNFPSATDVEKDVLKLPYWEYDPIPGNNQDWFNGQGALNECEFAGRFDVTGINVAGPLVGVGIQENPNLQFSVYPNPNQTGVLHIEASGLNKLEIYSLDGKLVVTLTQNNLTSINIAHLAKGVYVIKGYDRTAVYSTKFIKQ